MSKDLVARYADALPRYTSYPTAPHFTAAVTPATCRRWLEALPAGSTLSLYLHIPFCDTLCWFCGCHTKITRKHAPVAAYLGVLKREIADIAALIPKSCKVSHVHWGGGSPTILPEDDILALGDSLHEAFDWTGDAEFAVEIDPRGLSQSQVAALARIGLTRASIGVQDFEPQVQQAINRIQTFEETRRVVDDLRSHGLTSLNLDLIYGLPYQNEASIARTIDQSLRLGPDRIALFGYAHVPWMKKHQQMIPAEALPDAQTRFAQAKMASERLVAAGFSQIGLDHFARAQDSLAVAARAGKLRRNFQGYTTDPADALIGLGASSIGQLPQGYVQNEPAIAEYMRRAMRGELATVRGFALSKDDRVRGQIIERLMCDLSLDFEAIAQTCGEPIEAYLPARAVLEAFACDGIITSDDKGLSVSELGRPFLRSVAALFDEYLKLNAARHSLAV